MSREDGMDEVNEPHVEWTSAWCIGCAGNEVAISCECREGDFAGTVYLMSDLTIKAEGSDVEEWPMRRYRAVELALLKRYAEWVQKRYQYAVADDFGIDLTKELA